MAGLSFDNSTLLLFDFRTQQWRKLAHANLMGYLAWSADSRYIYFDTLFEQNPAYHRVRIADGKPRSLRQRPYLPISSTCAITRPFIAPSNSFLLAPGFASSLASRAYNLKK